MPRALLLVVISLLTACDAARSNIPINVRNELPSQAEAGRGQNLAYEKWKTRWDKKVKPSRETVTRANFEKNDDFLTKLRVGSNAVRRGTCAFDHNGFSGMSPAERLKVLTTFKRPEMMHN